jgi:glyoxylase-like metal-dependent hydrolase (beta-lactamase superfamily II)
VRHIESDAPRSARRRYHALFAVIDHPQHGVSLFDTGYAPRFFDATRHWPYRAYRAVTPVVTHEKLAAVEVLKSHGVEPGDVRRIILSHFHADHVGGLKDFPHADVIAGSRCWDAVRRRTGIAALRRAFLPALLPPGLADRLCLLDRFHDPGFGPFDRGHDLFADGSVRLVELPGHAAGQLGMLVQRGPDDRVLLAADAVWTSRTVRENLPPTWPVRFLADSLHDSLATQQRLHELHRQFPDIEIIPTHCPEVAARYGFDAIVDDIAGPGAARSREAATCAS